MRYFSSFVRTLAALIFCVVAGCGSEYDFRPLSSFKIIDTALSNADTVDVIYCSGGPQEHKHELVVS